MTEEKFPRAVPEEKKPMHGRPYWLTYKDQYGCDSTLVCHFISGMKVVMSKDNVQCAAAFIASGGASITVECGQNLTLANALIEYVRMSLLQPIIKQDEEGNALNWEGVTLQLGKVIALLKTKVKDTSILTPDGELAQ